MKDWTKVWWYGLSIHPGIAFIPMLMILGAIAGGWFGFAVMGMLASLPVAMTAHSVGAANIGREP